jgi:hypothetical protein
VPFQDHPFKPKYQPVIGIEDDRGFLYKAGPFPSLLQPLYMATVARAIDILV